MSRENLAQSLDAAATALTHMTDQLARGGFEAGAASYTEMANIILGQRMWAQSQEITEFDTRFDEIASLASRIHEQLAPYCAAMEKLRALAGLMSEEDDLDPLDRRVIEALEAANKPMTATAVASATRSPSADVRRRLIDLSDREVIRKIGSPSRPRFAVAGVEAHR